MSKELAARCGIYCGECEYKEQFDCPGCLKAEGKIFWGECKLAKCSIEKGHRHCGECSSFACSLINDFSYDKEQGDEGQRIRNIEKWNEEGLENWIKNRS